jgi:hypothetical protein
VKESGRLVHFFIFAHCVQQNYHSFFSVLVSYYSPKMSSPNQQTPQQPELQPMAYVQPYPQPYAVPMNQPYFPGTYITT